MSYRAAQWCLFFAFLAHNVEEAATAGAYLPRIRSVASEILGVAVVAVRVTPTSFGWALVAVSAAGLVTALLGRRWPYLSIVLAAVMLVNVVMPHVPAAVALGGYSPGLVTAVLVNLPYSGWFLRRSLREGSASRRGIVAAIVVAPVVMVVALGLVFVITTAATAVPD
ncbi:MAG: HXXEE domain-containing protein [Thermoanaerobaculia bacterium]